MIDFVKQFDTDFVKSMIAGIGLLLPILFFYFYSESVVRKSRESSQTVSN